MGLWVVQFCPHCLVFYVQTILPRPRLRIKLGKQVEVDRTKTKNCHSIEYPKLCVKM